MVHKRNTWIIEFNKANLMHIGGHNLLVRGVSHVSCTWGSTRYATTSQCWGAVVGSDLDVMMLGPKTALNPPSFLSISVDQGRLSRGGTSAPVGASQPDVLAEDSTESDIKAVPECIELGHEGTQTTFRKFSGSALGGCWPPVMIQLTQHTRTFYVETARGRRRWAGCATRSVP